MLDFGLTHRFFLHQSSTSRILIDRPWGSGGLESSQSESVTCVDSSTELRNTRSDIALVAHFSVSQYKLQYV